MVKLTRVLLGGLTAGVMGFALSGCGENGSASTPKPTAQGGAAGGASGAASGGAGAAGGGAGGAAGGGAAGGGAGKAPARKFAVRTAPVETKPVVYEIQAVGNLVEENKFEIPARVAGVAEGVTFSEGDEVTTGQEL